MTPSTYNVQNQRLIKANLLPYHKRIFNRCVAYVIIFFLIFIHLIGRIFFRKKVTCKRPARILLTGRFESDNWLRAHVKPLADSEYCEHVWVVADSPLIPLNNVSYICPNKYFVSTFGSVFSRLLYLFFYSMKYRIDIVGGFHLLVNAVVVGAVARLLRRKSLYFCVGGWSEIIGGGAYSGTPIFGHTGTDDKYLEKKLQLLVSYMDRVIVMGSQAKAYWAGCGIKHVEVLPGGIERAVFSTTNYLKEKDFDIILVARLDPVKRIDRFIEIVRILSEMNPELRTVIIGDSELKDEYEKLACQFKIKDNILFAGHKKNVSEWLMRSKIFLLTSDSEGLPLSCMEAMMMGLPIVASDVGDLRDLVLNGENGYLIKADDISGFVTKIQDILGDENKYVSLSESARISSGPFQYEAAKNSWDNVLLELGFSK